MLTQKLNDGLISFTLMLKKELLHIYLHGCQRELIWLADGDRKIITILISIKQTRFTLNIQNLCLLPAVEYIISFKDIQLLCRKGLMTYTVESVYISAFQVTSLKACLTVFGSYRTQTIIQMFNLCFDIYSFMSYIELQLYKNKTNQVPYVKYSHLLFWLLPCGPWYWSLFILAYLKLAFYSVI